jgi:hypothetical protein
MQVFRNPNLAAAVGVVAAATIVPASFAQAHASPEIDAAALVRRAVANHLSAEQAHPLQRFTLHKKDDRHDYSQIVIETRQGDVALAIAANGAPLSAEMHQAQIDRLDDLDQHPDLQEHRRKREEEDMARANKLLRLLPDAFVYQYEAMVPCVGSSGAEAHGPQGASAETTPAAGDCYKLAFTPKPDWDPPDTESKILRGMAGEVLIDKSAERLTQLNAHLITDVDFGWGIIGHLDKGGTVFLEQSLVEPGDWELTRMKLNLTGRALMVKALVYHISEEMSSYSAVAPNLDYHEAIRMLKAEPATSGQ